MPSPASPSRGRTIKNVTAPTFRVRAARRTWLSCSVWAATSGGRLGLIGLIDWSEYEPPLSFVKTSTSAPGVLPIGSSGRPIFCPVPLSDESTTPRCPYSPKSLTSVQEVEMSKASIGSRCRLHLTHIFGSPLTILVVRMGIWPPYHQCAGEHCKICRRGAGTCRGGGRNRRTEYY